MRFIGRIIFITLFLTAFGVAAYSQETQTRVVDEVVAQVNDGVITLSRIKREIKDIVDSEVKEGKKREDAQREVDEKQGELIANLINEELLIQKAKELNLDSEIDASMNQRMNDIMKQYNLKTVEALYAEMEKSGVNPQDLKQTWRVQATRDKVLARELQSKIYWGLSGKELKDYYEAHKDKFTKPETVSISELFLGFAGRDEAAVREKAKQLYKQLKAGGDWDKIVKENSDPSIVTQGTGKAEKLKVSELNATVGDPLKGIKPGDYTLPWEADQLGLVILRVDAREEASNDSVFDDNAVRLALMAERYPAEQQKYFAKLRSEAYIKINDTYRPMVSPILFADERKEKPGN